LISVSLDAVEEPLVGTTPWVLLLVTDEEKRRRARTEWETAGFAVEIVASANDALECLKVMTPSLVVVDDRLYRPAPR
jgi:ActR/RegA family two-component response regulator